MRVGAAEVDITPEKGIPLAGYYSERGAEGTHDPLMAKAIVLDDGVTKVALVGLDLIGTTKAMVDGARVAIESGSGIHAGNVMISATHTHTGPITGGSARYESEFSPNSAARVEIRRIPLLVRHKSAARRG